MRRLLLRAAVADEAPNALDDSLGLLEVGKVSGALDELETGSWNGRAIGGPVILGADEPVVGTPEEQRGHGDAVQPLGQLRIVEVRLHAYSAVASRLRAMMASSSSDFFV